MILVTRAVRSGYRQYAIGEGQWTAMLFNTQFDGGGPPFGGSIDEYIDLFQGVFKEIVIDEEPASIEPRKGREVFVIEEIGGI